MAKIYQNNEVVITVDRENEDEASVNINGRNLIWISREEQDEFTKELTKILNKYRI